MGGTCVAYREEEKSTEDFGGETRKIQLIKIPRLRGTII
jgi:hypothetical protein